MARLGRLAISLFLFALVLTGCVPPLVCPAVGYINTLTITVTDPNIQTVECVEGCDGVAAYLTEGEAGWSITFGAGSPHNVALIGLGENGEEIVRETFALEWIPDDPANACGSSASAGPVELG